MENIKGGSFVKDGLPLSDIGKKDNENKRSIATNNEDHEVKKLDFKTLVKRINEEEIKEEKEEESPVKIEKIAVEQVDESKSKEKEEEKVMAEF